MYSFFNLSLNAVIEKGSHQRKSVCQLHVHYQYTKLLPSEKNRAKSKKLDEDAMLCNTLWSDRRRLITKTFLAFSRSSKRRN